MNEQELAERLQARMDARMGIVPEPAEEEAPEEEEAAGEEEAPQAEAAPQEAAAEEAPAEEAEEETEEERLYAGKYRTVEEMEKAVSEQDYMISRQGTEIGELRSMIEQYRQQTQAEISDLRYEGWEPDEEWEEWADGELQKAQVEGDLVALEAMIAAGEEAGPAAARYVLSRWHALDPAAATAFQLDALAAQREQTGPDLPIQGSGPDQQTVDQAWAYVGQRHPDVAEYRSEMSELMMTMSAEERSRWEKRVLADPSATQDFVEHLYYRVKAGKAEARLQERERAANEALTRKADAEAAEATVASAATSLPRQEPSSRRNSQFDRDAFREAAGLAPRE